MNAMRRKAQSSASWRYKWKGIVWERHATLPFSSYLELFSLAHWVGDLREATNV